MTKEQIAMCIETAIDSTLGDIYRDLEQKNTSTYYVGDIDPMDSMRLNIAIEDIANLFLKLIQNNARRKETE